MINAIFINNFSKPRVSQDRDMITNKPKISFNGYISDIISTDLFRKDLATLAKPLRQNSWLFRDELPEQLDIIKKSFDKERNLSTTCIQPNKFFIYGCSDGHEPYSIIMYLIKKYGSLEEAKKKVELHSIDIPSPGLKMAKEKTLDVYDDIFNYGCDYPELLNLNLISDDTDILNKVRSEQKISIKDNIFKYANFKKGRILDDFKPNGKFNEKEPVAVFFRNALPYIIPDLALKFIKDLHAKLPDKSFFCVGRYEQCSGNKPIIDELKNLFKVVYNGGIFGEDPYLFKKES